MDTNEGQYITRKIVGYSLTLQEAVSLPPGSPCGMPTSPHYLSLDMSRHVNDHLEIGRCLVTVEDRELS